MPEEKKESGQKFSSGKVYKENNTDFSSFLHINEDEDDEIVVQPEEKKEVKEVREIKEENKNDYSSLLQKAMEDNDLEFDELEEGFEAEVGKIEAPINNEKKQDIN